ncbi:hypothetical protein [Isoalcanivorax pacificus]|uniref:hypothetical protein n=1 Tax=Isoalcanivorax pacificus TaxID=1306787 RepID=UPI001184C362|nr:hypothetical protein [Isoalcanivorax pacificus]
MKGFLAFPLIFIFAVFFPLNVHAQCSKVTITSLGSCAGQPAGSSRIAIKNNGNQEVRQEINVNWRHGIDRGTSVRSYDLIPGQQQVLGCTVMHGLPYYYYYSYSKKSCSPL